MSYDALARAQTRLEGFDGDHWGNQLAEAQAQVAERLTAWEAEDAGSYSPEGQAKYRAQLRQPEDAARARAAHEADAAFAAVAEAKAVIEVYTGLTDAEMKTAEGLRWRYREDAEMLAPAELARKIEASVRLDDKVACYLFARYVGRRIQQLSDEFEAAGDNVDIRTRARLGIEALRPAAKAATAALESSRVAELRTVIAEAEAGAHRLRARSRVASAADMRASKRGVEYRL